MTISLLHPSRSRPKQAADAFKRWLTKASGQHKIEHILSIDYDDPHLEGYKGQDYNHEWTLILAGNNTNAVQATNKAAAASHGDILIMLSDDFECQQNWDKLIVDAYVHNLSSTSPDGYVLKTFDGLQKWIVTLAIMDRAYYEMQGYFYYPEYKHMFCDTEMTHKAELEGRLIVRNDLIFPHNHYSQGKTKKDETNRRADDTWNQGEALYLRRVRENFGLTGVDAMKCSDVNNQNWLRNKLKQYV